MFSKWFCHENIPINPILVSFGLLCTVQSVYSIFGIIFMKQVVLFHEVKNFGKIHHSTLHLSNSVIFQWIWKFQRWQNRAPFLSQHTKFQVSWCCEVRAINDLKCKATFGPPCTVQKTPDIIFVNIKDDAFWKLFLQRVSDFFFQNFREMKVVYILSKTGLTGFSH